MQHTKKTFQREKLKLKNKITWKENDEWVEQHSSYSLDRSTFTINIDKVKKPNISSHRLVDLCGLNKYASVGKTLLSMFGFLEKSEIPLYQSVKGGIAEEFATRYLDELYGGRYNIESFTLEQFSGFNQFPHSKPFSGALDKLIHGDVKLPVEIKSKELREYNKIAIDGKYPKDQVMQGANQAFMFGADSFMMLYVFLKPEVSAYLQAITEETPAKRIEIINGKEVEIEYKESLWLWGDDYATAIKELGLKYDDFVFHHKIMTYDKRIINAYRERAQKIYDDFLNTRTLPRHAFKKEELEDLKEFIE